MDRVGYAMTAAVDAAAATAVLGIGDFQNKPEERVILGSMFIISAGIGIISAILSDSE